MKHGTQETTAQCWKRMYKGAFQTEATRHVVGREVPVPGEYATFDVVMRIYRPGRQLL